MIRKSNPRAAWAALVGALSLALLVAGAGTAFASGRTAGAKETSTKTTAETTEVNVVVSDMHGQGMEEHAPGTMTMAVTPESAPHGKVKFTVANEGTELHEMVVIKTDTPYDQLQVNSKNKISEKGSVGEISSIGKGKTKSKTFKLKAGQYALVCNLTGHYAAGMRAPFTVTDESATGETTAPATAEPSDVSVVVSDMHGQGMEEHAPGTMTMAVTPESAPHGKVKFTVANEGTELHEMVVIKTDTPYDQLQVNSKNKISEKGSVGEISSIGKGKTKSKTFKLKAGQYALVCNLTGHYAAGMRAPFTVT